MTAWKIRFLGEIEGSLRAQLIARELGAEPVEDVDDADLIVTTPLAFEEMLEDAAAAAAFHNTRDQESIPTEMVNRLLAGGNAVKVWREHRGLTQRALAAQAGLNFAYLSQIETGARKGTIDTLRKLARALNVDLDDLI